MRANRSFFGKKLEELAIKKNLSQKDIANKLGVSKEMISIWVTGRRNPSLNSIKKIANALDVSTNYFIEDKENKNISEIELLKKENELLRKENFLLKKELKLKKK